MLAPSRSFDLFLPETKKYNWTNFDSERQEKRKKSEEWEGTREKISRKRGAS
jgi:hypothetical protein